MTVGRRLRESLLPRTDARLLLCHVMNWTHAGLIARQDRVLDEVSADRFVRLENRRLQGEPLAYIVGEKEFYSRPFSVTPAVLVPRPETELLLELALARLPEKGRMWDLGTGSGAVAISAACERADADVLASDISSAALAVAGKNAAALSARVGFACGSWFDICPAPAAGSFDVMVSNPPYIRADDDHLQGDGVRFEPPGALTDFGDGLEPFRQITAGAGRFLKSGGSLLVEHGFDQGADVRLLFSAAGFAGVRTDTDLAGQERVTSGFWNAVITLPENNK